MWANFCLEQLQSVCIEKENKSTKQSNIWRYAKLMDKKLITL